MITKKTSSSDISGTEIEKKESALALPKDYFEQNANVGLTDLTVEDVPVPTLTVIQSTSKMRDDEGRPYVPGKLYYKAIRHAYDTVDCVILVITKKQMPTYEDRGKMERTFMVLGAIEPSFMPFMMYCKSSAYFSTRQFIGEVKARKQPMYALRVQISTEKRQNDQGEWYVPVFTIVGMRSDPDEIVMLENLAKEFDSNKETLKSQEEENQLKTSEVPQVNEGETVDPNDVPF